MLGGVSYTCNPSYSRQKQGDFEFKASLGEFSRLYKKIEK
jgi:hypothetical protein